MGEDDRYEELAGYLNALANPRRLELLDRLRVPRTIGEIDLRPSRGEADRPISRTAVERHMMLLKAIGVVGNRPGVRDGRQVEEYVLQHQRLFQVVEELRGLTQLRPRTLLELETTVSDAPPTLRVPLKGPRVLLLSGPFEGRAHTLEGDGPWQIGRAATSQIPLDYDPYVSSEHAMLHRLPDGGYEVEDLKSNRNGTLLNWGQVPRGRRAPLESGDVLRVGRSNLLFRVDRTNEKK